MSSLNSSTSNPQGAPGPVGAGPGAAVDSAVDARPFVSGLDQAASRYILAVLHHPFMRELADGSLSDERFVYFLVQDHHFLQSAARAFSQVVSRIKDDEWLVHFNQCSTEVLVLEKSVHSRYFERFGLTLQTVSVAKVAPTNEGYSCYLENLADRADFSQALCALLPCFWFYRDVARHMASMPSLHERFRAWAEFYGGEAYDALVESLLDLVEEVAADASASARESMRSRFVHSARYEWMFWEMCYHMECWPEP